MLMAHLSSVPMLLLGNNMLPMHVWPVPTSTETKLRPPLNLESNCVLPWRCTVSRPWNKKDTNWKNQILIQTKNLHLESCCIDIALLEIPEIFRTCSCVKKHGLSASMGWITLFHWSYIKEFDLMHLRALFAFLLFFSSVKQKKWKKFWSALFFCAKERFRNKVITSLLRIRSFFLLEKQHTEK